MTAETSGQHSWVQRTQPQAAKKAESTLRIATYNIENLHPGVGDPDPSNNDRLDRLAGSIVKHLESPDILSLQEVQDNNGPKNNGTTDASETLQELVDAIVAQGGPRYAFTDIAPKNNVDGGQPGSNIRNAFLYNPEKVTLREAAGGKGRHDENVEVVQEDDGVHLSVNPGRIHPEFHCFDDSRKPLVAEFIDHASGENLFIANVHLVSKAGDPEIRDPQRVIQAQTIGGFAEDLYNALRKNGQDANIMITGDFNAQPSEYPVQVLDDQPFLQNLAGGLESGEYYTYVHRGEKLAIDHMIASVDMSLELDAEAKKINAGKGENIQASDHNPVVYETDLSKATGKGAEKPAPQGRSM